MPKNKDLKRLVRSRMQKTGESFTTARSRVLAKGRMSDERAAPQKSSSKPGADPAAVTGMHDDAVVAKTGRSWAQWLDVLDAAGAAAMTHTEIATLVHAKFGQTGWWSQMVTVGYERLRGRRQKNQTTSGFAVSKSKTFALPLAALLAAFAPGARSEWLGDAPVKARKSTHKVVRWTAADGSWVDVYLWPKAAAKTLVSVQNTRLRSSTDVENARAAWGDRLQALASWLARRDAT
jgi:hypothetical protein